MSDSKTTHMEVWFDTSNAETSVQCLNDMVAGLKTSLDGVVGKLEEMVELMSTQEGGWLDSLVGGVDAFNTMADGREKLEGMQQLLCIYLKRMQQK